MVRRSDLGKSPESSNPLQNLRGVPRMLPHLVHLHRAQLAGFVQDQIGDTELADVVKQAGATKRGLIVFTQSHGPRDSHRDVGDAFRMPRGIRRLRVHHPGERLGDAVEPLVVRQNHPVGGFQVSHLIDRIHRTDGRPESGVVPEGLQCRDQLGIEPASPTPAGDLVGRVRPKGVGKYLDRLRQPGDASQQRDGVALEAEGHAASIPVLVQGTDCVLGRGISPSIRAMSAPRSQRSQSFPPRSLFAGAEHQGIARRARGLLFGAT
jgi:hypothetical protein